MRPMFKVELSLGAYYFFYFALVGVYVVFMPKALNDLGYTPTQVGIIYAAAPFMRFLIPFVFKHYLTLTRKVYLISLALTFVASLLFFATYHTFTLHLFANLIFGAAMGISLPYVETIALARMSKGRYGKVRLWGSIGFMSVAMWLGANLQSAYETFAYLGILSFATLIFGAVASAYDTPTTQEQGDAKDFSLLRYPFFWLSVFLMQMGFGGFYNFFTIYETSYGISLEVTSWLWSFGVLCEIVMLYFQGPLLRKNLLVILEIATLATALRWLIFHFFPSSLVMLFLAQSLHALSFALYHSAAITYVYALYTQKKLAQQFFLGIAFGLGGSIGAVFAGLAYGEYLFLIEAYVTFAAFVALAIHHKRSKEKDDGHIPF